MGYNSIYPFSILAPTVPAHDVIRRCNFPLPVSGACPDHIFDKVEVMAVFRPVWRHMFQEVRPDDQGTMAYMPIFYLRHHAPPESQVVVVHEVILAVFDTVQVNLHVDGADHVIIGEEQEVFTPGIVDGKIRLPESAAACILRKVHNIYPVIPKGINIGMMVPLF